MLFRDPTRLLGVMASGREETSWPVIVDAVKVELDIDDDDDIEGEAGDHDVGAEKLQDLRASIDK
jgi:hypothetical protein